MDCYPVKVGISVVIYCLSVSAVPIYNKLVFSGVAQGNGVKKFPYPIATAFLQLGFVSLVLGLANILGHFRHRGGPKAGASWLLGPHLGYKLYHVAPVGLLFGLKYGLTNWGLQLMPTGTHLLLQSTDLVWTVLAARVWNKEKLGVVEHVAAGLAVAGSLLIGLHAGQVLSAPLVPLLVNCLTPLVLALCIATLRSGAQELFHPGNRLQGSVSPAEFTCLKLLLSSSVALLLSTLMENGVVFLSRWQEVHREAWWDAVRHEEAASFFFMLLGGVWVLIFQVNITWLSGLTSAVSVGIVGGVKVVPQWLLNAAFLGSRVDMSLPNMAGTFLVLSASCLYACSISRERVLVWASPSGFVWQQRQPCEAGEPLLAVETPEQLPEGLRSFLPPMERLLTPSSMLDRVPS